MGEMLVFDYMYKDEICSHVEINFKTEEVKNEDFTDNLMLTVFGLNAPSLDSFQDFLEDRVFSPNRPDVDVLCEMLGVKGFNPLEIVKETHGRMWGGLFLDEI